MVKNYNQLNTVGYNQTYLPAVTYLVSKKMSGIHVN